MSSVFPVEPESVLTRWERVWFWFASNRKYIGGVILVASTFVRAGLHFQGHSEAADTLKAIADLFMGTGAALATAGATHGDEHFAEKKQAVMRGRSNRGMKAFDPAAYGRP